MGLPATRHGGVSREHRADAHGPTREPPPPWPGSWGEARAHAFPRGPSCCTGGAVHGAGRGALAAHVLRPGPCRARLTRRPLRRALPRQELRPPSPASKHRDLPLPRGRPCPGPGNTFRRGPERRERSASRPRRAVCGPARDAWRQPTGISGVTPHPACDRDKGRSCAMSDRCPPGPGQACFPTTGRTQAGHETATCQKHRVSLEGRGSQVTDKGFLPLSPGCGGWGAELCPPGVLRLHPDPGTQHGAVCAHWDFLRQWGGP